MQADIDNPDFDALSDLAKKFRESGDFEKALSVSRRCAKLNPEVWWVFKDIASDMAKTGDVPGADFMLEQGLERFPNQFWLVYNYVLLAHDLGENQEAVRRSTHLLHLSLTSGQDQLSSYEMGKLYRLCGFVYQKGLFHQISADFFAKALSYEGSSSESKLDFEWQTLYSRVGQNARSRDHEIIFEISAKTQRDYKVYYINLAEEKARKLRLEERFNSCSLDFHRINAVDGRVLPQNIVNMVTRSQHYPFLGTLGCFMSHVKAWEKIVSEGLEYALILEDDALPATHLPRNFRTFNIPADFDVCFVNKGMEPLFVIGELAHVQDFTAVRAIDALAGKAKFLRGPGLQAYFLSQVGAKKLLSLVTEDGYGGHVDWRVVSYGLSRHDSYRFPEDSPARWFAERSRSVAQLQSYSLFPALIDVDRQVVSNRDTNDTTPMAT